MTSRQLPLGLSFPRDLRLDGYRDAPDGLLRTLAGIAAGGRDGAFVAGPAGCGKTHLLLATCAQAVAADLSVAYLPLRSLGDRAAVALAGQGAVRVACVDDVDAILGQQAAELALFDLHNRLRDAGCALLYAANAMPAQLPVALPDLRSRLAHGARFALVLPDETLRRRILCERAALRGLELDDAVLDYLFRRVDRDLASLTRLLDRLDRASLAAQRRVTVPFLKGVLETAG
ncbi:MAG: DnaA regulatory inactivator Hda [Proteobacteria bacterium]|nr:DnaA regulatory inactivator Hda [Pseudomonadota bacterium]